MSTKLFGWHTSKSPQDKTKTGIGLSIPLLGLVLLLAAGASAMTLEEAKQNPPPGTYWSEELRCLVLEEPIPLELPHSMLLKEDEDTVSFDGDTMFYVHWEMPDYFALTKMPTPTCESGEWDLTAVLLGCFNTIGQPPDPGKVVIYAYSLAEYCKLVSPDGDSLGDTLGVQPFVGLPYDPWYPDSIPRARWTQVDFDVPVTISETLFWVAWDYTPIVWGPSYYVIGNYRQDPPMTSADSLRFFEWYGSPCPTQMDRYGPWLIRAVGHCRQGTADIDIKPRSCPNPLNTGSNGLLPVAILGTEDFDVTTVDPTTIQLEGAPALRWAVDDVAAPFPGELCDCWTEGPDGFDDLTMKFIIQDIVEAIGEVNDRDTLVLTLTWELFDGTSMKGSDCIVVLKRELHKRKKRLSATEGHIQLAAGSSAPNVFALYQNSPNPFRNGTTISFSLPEKAHTTLSIHDVRGRTVAVLLDQERAAGIYTVEWNTDISSGIYFCRLRSGDLTAAKKLIQMR